MDFNKICVVGLGYIGLPTAATFASYGVEVVGVDVNSKVVEALNEGKVIIEEPDLDEMVLKAVQSGKLRASLKAESADAFIIAVPTPITEDKKADMTYVKAAAESIVPYLKAGDIVILESTSPTGTVEELMCPILEKSGLKLGEELFVGHSPERVLPGQILKELIYNNRLVGGINRVSAEKIRDLYKIFVKGEIYLTTATTAEMCKMMENTFRDVNIALANELAKLCENLGINAWEVINLCNKHPRVNLHLPGPGVGGHCLAVDPWFIIEKDPETAKIIELGRRTNDSMPAHVLKRIKEIKKENAISDDLKVTVLGITYKPDIDDMRESPIMELIGMLEEEKINFSVFDPHVENYHKNEKNIADACESSDILVLGVNHKQFKELPLESIYNVMRSKVVFDTRNFLNKSQVEDFGFKYYLLGSK
jgi:UDP-N-acetyl-D-mannosaminuronic acid dehydrogenase